VLRRRTPSLRADRVRNRSAGLIESQGFMPIGFLHRGKNNPGDAFEQLSMHDHQGPERCWDPAAPSGDGHAYGSGGVSGKKAKSHGLGLMRMTRNH